MKDDIRIRTLLKKIEERVKACDDRTKENRARKGAYVDCILLIKEYTQ